MADSSEGLQSSGHRTRRTGAPISVLYIRKKTPSQKLLEKCLKPHWPGCHMDVPAIREGGDVNFSTSFGERGQRSQLSITNQIKHPFLFLTTLGWSLSVLAAARQQVRERGMEGKSLLCFSLLLLHSLPTPHYWWCPQPWP